MVHSPSPINNQLDLLPSGVLHLILSLLELNEMNGSQPFPQDMKHLVSLLSLDDESNRSRIAGLSSSLREKHRIQELNLEDLASRSDGEIGGSYGGRLSSVLLVLRSRRSWRRDRGSGGDDRCTEGLEEWVAWVEVR